MLDEVNPKLYELCEAAVSQIIDRFVSSLKTLFVTNYQTLTPILTIFSQINRTA